jgi:hypothetical protein
MSLFQIIFVCLFLIFVGTFTSAANELASERVGTQPQNLIYDEARSYCQNVGFFFDAYQHNITTWNDDDNSWALTTHLSSWGNFWIECPAETTFPLEATQACVLTPNNTVQAVEKTSLQWTWCKISAPTSITSSSSSIFNPWKERHHQVMTAFIVALLLVWLFFSYQAIVDWRFRFYTGIRLKNRISYLSVITIHYLALLFSGIAVIFRYIVSVYPYRDDTSLVNMTNLFYYVIQIMSGIVFMSMTVHVLIIWLSGHSKRNLQALKWLSSQRIVYNIYISCILLPVIYVILLDVFRFTMSWICNAPMIRDGEYTLPLYQ